MTPERVPVDVSMERVRCRVGAFAAAWDALPVSQQRVLVLRGDGLSLKEVASHLGLTPHTVKP